ncbi:MAG: CPBP family intramembrane metalloprotease [Polyangiaceae bacterium]|nr:CPBP family intramembrane metalloprotease [Polyangiaceae bacterium]
MEAKPELLEVLLVCASMLLFAALPALATSPVASWSAVGLTGGALVASVVARRPAARCVSTLAFLTALAWPFERSLLPWPITFALPLAVFAALALRNPAIRTGCPPLRRGSFGPSLVVRVFAIVAASSTALVLWVVLLRPDLSDLRGMLPSHPLPVLLLGGLGFALMNSVLEESAYRWVFQGALETTRLPPTAVIFLQGLAFGFMHIGGFPRGTVGVVLATIYGWMLGELRYRARGMVAPFIAHVFADLTIFAILLTMV